MMDKIERPISAEAFSGFKRIGRLENFVIMADLEMVQQVRVIKLGADGTPLTETIQADMSLSADRKRDLLQTYADKVVTRHTKGSFVSPATGQVVPEGTVGAIEQSQFLQNITLGMLKAQGLPISDNMPVLQIIYAMLANEIEAIDARGEL